MELQGRGGGADPGINVGGALLQRTLHLENIFQSALHLGPSQRALKKDLQNKNNNIEPRSVRNVHNLVERQTFPFLVNFIYRKRRPYGFGTPSLSLSLSLSLPLSLEGANVSFAPSGSATGDKKIKSLTYK